MLLMFIKNVKLVCLLFTILYMNPVVVLVSDVMGTDWHVTSRRLLPNCLLASNSIRC